ncbi:MAG: hypothetical protein ACI915_002951, partial [Gammaproteobacteria bacterium]
QCLGEIEHSDAVQNVCGLSHSFASLGDSIGRITRSDAGWWSPPTGKNFALILVEPWFTCLAHFAIAIE